MVLTPFLNRLSDYHDAGRVVERQRQNGKEENPPSLKHVRSVDEAHDTQRGDNHIRNGLNDIDNKQMLIRSLFLPEWFI